MSIKAIIVIAGGLITYFAAAAYIWQRYKSWNGVILLGCMIGYFYYSVIYQQDTIKEFSEKSRVYKELLDEEKQKAGT